MSPLPAAASCRSPRAAPGEDRRVAFTAPREGRRARPAGGWWSGGASTGPSHRGAQQAWGCTEAHDRDCDVGEWRVLFFRHRCQRRQGDKCFHGNQMHQRRVHERPGAGAERLPRGDRRAAVPAPVPVRAAGALPEVSAAGGQAGALCHGALFHGAPPPPPPPPPPSRNPADCHRKVPRAAASSVALGLDPAFHDTQATKQGGLTHHTHARTPTFPRTHVHTHTHVPTHTRSHVHTRSHAHSATTASGPCRAPVPGFPAL